MQAYREIKRFVKETLGCSCPDEVFNHIDCTQHGDDISWKKVNIGDRLLIYIITMNGSASIQDVVNRALQQGVEERNAGGFNRFRLVLVASRPDELRNAAEHAFDLSDYTDDKTHLHVVNETDMERLW